MIEIKNSPFIIGKLRDQADYLLNERVVSRIHARICYDEEEKVYYLEDMDSTNGTRINGVKIASGTRKKLIPGDLVTLADQEFIFR